MASTPTADYTPRALARALSRHKGKALLFAGCVMAIVAAVTFLGPATYHSESKLFVRLGRESVTLDPVATTSQHVQVSESRESEINSILDLLKSRVLLEKVVDKIGPKTVLGNGWGISELFAGPLGSFSSTDAEGTQYAQAKLRDQAIQHLTKTVRVWASRRSNVINVSCEAESPKLAQEVVGLLIENFRQLHTDANFASGTVDFFDAQTTQCRQVLDNAAVDFRDMKNKIGLTTLAAQHELLSRRIGLLQEQLSTTLSDAVAADSAVADMKAKCDQLPTKIVTHEEDGYPNHAADLMRAQLYALQLREQELRSLYQDDFPQVVEIQRQVKEAQAILDAQLSKRSQVTEGLNDSREQLHLAQLNEETKACSLRTKAEMLRKHLDEALAELRQLNDQEVKVAQLERELMLADANYRKYAEHLEQSRIYHALHDERISNINVVQPATYVLKPVRPKKLINLALGMLLAIGGGIATAYLAERMDRSLKSPSDVMQQLEVPVLVSIPRFKGQHQNGFTQGRANDLVNQ